MLLLSTSLTLPVLVTVVLPLGLILMLVLCLQCFKKKPKGFSNFRNSTNSINNSHGHFNTTFSGDIDDTVVDIPSTSSVSIEVLPDITTKSRFPSGPLRPRIGCLEKARQDSSLKSIVVHHPFPRSQIVYLKELGSSWFGKAIESDAEKITTGIARSKVVVKMLKDDASKFEQQMFYEEVAPFRELEHTNILRLLGQCTEMHPMLMILESAAFGNLKHYLRSHRQAHAALVQKNRLVQFSLDVSCGLACLHRHDYVHKDLAARNCLVMSDYTLKIGDYGIAEDLFKEDYFNCGSDLLPIRWMAPETLTNENGIWSSSQAYCKESDIWSLGVVLWEIFMMGERPYDMLTDEAVLQGVFVDSDIRLPEPDIDMPYKDRLYEVMRFCWLAASQRTKVNEVYSLLQQIASQVPSEDSGKDNATAFEKKWEHLVPRHSSIDSVDQQESVSSVDSDLLAEDISQPDFFNDFEHLNVKEQNQSPQAPPRTSRKKVSAAANLVPQADLQSEDISFTSDKKPDGLMKPPKIILTSEQLDQNLTKNQIQSLNQNTETTNAVETKPSSGFEVEFTEFTSHDSFKDAKGEPSPKSLTALKVQPSPDLSLDLQKVDNQSRTTESKEDAFQFSAGDAFTKVQTELEEDSYVVSTPDKTQPKPRKTSTPLSKDKSSPSSSSSFSGGDSSSATFLTAQTSSPGNLTDAYATASDSTLVIQDNKTESSDFTTYAEQPSVSEDESLSFDILDATTIPSVMNDFKKSETETQNAELSGSFESLDARPHNTFDEFNKDDSFGEYTDSGMSGTYSSTAQDFSVDSPMADFTPFTESDISVIQNDFFDFDNRFTAASQEEGREFSWNDKAFSENKTDQQELDEVVSSEHDVSAVQADFFDFDNRFTAASQEKSQELPWNDKAFAANKTDQQHLGDMASSQPDVSAVQDDFFDFDSKYSAASQEKSHEFSWNDNAFSANKTDQLHLGEVASSEPSISVMEAGFFDFDSKSSSASKEKSHELSWNDKVSSENKTGQQDLGEVASSQPDVSAVQDDFFYFDSKSSADSQEKSHELPWNEKAFSANNADQQHFDDLASSAPSILITEADFFDFDSNSSNASEEEGLELSWNDKVSSENKTDQQELSEVVSSEPDVSVGQADFFDFDNKFSAASQKEGHEFSWNDKAFSANKTDQQDLGEVVSSKPDVSAVRADFFDFDNKFPTISREEGCELSWNDKVSSESKTDQQELGNVVSLRSEKVSVNSHLVSAALADGEQTFPGFATEFSSLASLDTNSSESPQAEAQTNPFAFEQFGEISEPAVLATPSKDVQNSSEIHGVGDFSFLNSFPDAAEKTLFLDDGEPVVASEQSDEHNQQASDITENLNASSFDDFNTNSEAWFQSRNVPMGGHDLDISSNNANQCDTVEAATDLSELMEPVSEDIATGSLSSSDFKSSNDPGPSSTLSGLDLLSGFFSAPTSSTDTNSSSLNPFNQDGGLLQDFVGIPATASASAPKVGNGLEVSCANFSGETESSISSTDTDSTSNSDSGKDYICEEPWGEAAISPAASCSPTGSMDNEDYALQIASEIYLSRGLKLARPYETSVLEPIPEDPGPSVSEESCAPTPSETSSVDVKFEEVFEWDDFMGESLVGNERTSPDSGSPRHNFEMLDWSADTDNESLRSASSQQSRSSDNQKKGSSENDSLSTGWTDASKTTSSSTDSEMCDVISHGSVYTHRSHLSDLLGNRTKGLSLNAFHSQTLNQSKLYSLYKEDFDLDLDSPSDSSCSPPVPLSASEPGGPPLWGGVSTLHSKQHSSPFSGLVGGEDSASADIQDAQDNDVLITNGSGDLSPDAFLLDFSAFESNSASTTEASAADETVAESKSTSNTNGASSLIEF